MTREKWFISDTHFFHDNIIRYCGRPFSSAREMNEIMVARWNAAVAPGDNVYHLGDVACGYGGDERALAELLFSLNGRKRLVVGNHDPLKSPALHKAFEKMELWKGFKEHDFTAVHIPLEIASLRDGNFCVHGHTHNHARADPRYINVCVERRGYAPVHLDTILAEIAEARKTAQATSTAKSS